MRGITFRPGIPEDAPDLVEIVRMAGEGLPEIVWKDMAEPGETVRDVGLRRAAGETGSFSYRNATLCELDGAVVGGVVGYMLAPEPVEIGPDFPEMFVPLQELENLVPEHWYVNILATYPEHRGKGIGAALLAFAEQLAAVRGARGMSIIVFSSNEGAERLYRRTGYREVARRRMAIPGWQHDGCDAILLVKPF
ncbi:MAG: GNAT family N-acetyltransferase [Silicimonas sp.]|jgi:ribosomal protein S18 acetylase RimI-like enzyme|nr:GNAT family N-acetyltransferase [Silicimonas sp.]